MKLTLLLLLFGAFPVLGQTPGTNNWETEEIKIESGAIIKYYNAKKLDHFTVQIDANYYTNSFFFTKEKDTITIKNRVESDAIIKIYVKNKKKVSTFLHKGKPIFYTEVIDFNLNKLPAKSTIWSSITNTEKVSYLYHDNLSKAAGEDFEKSYKLYIFLKTSENNVTADLIFNQIADFFSQEDGILRIYLSGYRDKINFKAGSNKTAYLTTNDLGKIKNGILWTETGTNQGEYFRYENEQIVKSEKVNITSFQDIFTDYFRDNRYLEN